MPLSTKRAPRSDSRVPDFLRWFQEEYRRQRAGADYLIVWKRDSALVKQLLAATGEGEPGLEKLKVYARILLSDKCEDDWIQQSDRGLGVLYLRFNWLSHQYAQWRRDQGNHTIA